jgi:hypothetical protein
MFNVRALKFGEGYDDNTGKIYSYCETPDGTCIVIAQDDNEDVCLTDEVRESLINYYNTLFI